MARYAAAPYAERASIATGAFDLRAAAAWGSLAARWSRPSGILRFGDAVQALAHDLAGRSGAALLAEAAALRPSLLRDADRLQARAFALVHVAVERHLGLRYYPVQLAGGRNLLRRTIVEMATGEGKTITAALPAATAALAGKAVHVVTVNDYLAERDAERLRPVYAALGLSVGLVREGDEPAARRAAYAADITYVTNKELTFDYLKDRIATAKARGGGRHAVAAALDDRRAALVLRGLHVAIVDEADSVLIDEARTPLIISADRADSGLIDMVQQALGIARSLKHGDDYRIDAGQRVARLTPAGQQAVDKASLQGTGLFRARYAREQIVTQALTALHLFERDQHYIVAAGKISIVDEYTGRVMPDRTWEQGLHQLIEAKEGLELSSARETLAGITYQRFFNRYMTLSGMSGTVLEVAGELRSVYGLRVVRLPPHRPLLRRNLGATLRRDAAAKWQEVANRAAAQAAQGRPVLIGTQSVGASESLSAVLEERRLPHVVLNARQDAAEAEIVAQAGEAGRITVATNMAGRGTDIGLARGVAQAGGLHVILTGYHDSTRVDRQLFGRAARQGDPGSFEAVVALDDEIFARFAAGLVRSASALALPQSIALRLLRRHAQAAASRSNARQRRQQVRADERAEKGMGFTARE